MVLCGATINHANSESNKYGNQFKKFVEENADYPMIQIYKAELKDSEQNFDEAFIHYSRALELGIEDAFKPIKYYVEENLLNEGNLKLALNIIKTRALNTIEYSIFLADYYHHKINNKEDAFKWLNNSLRLGADVNEIMAEYIISKDGNAHKYYTDLEGATLLKKAADNGSLSAANKIAGMFDNGIIVPKNHGQARHYYEAAIELDDLDSLFRLAYFYEYGIGGNKDLQSAIETYKKLIGTHHEPEAHYRLSKIYSSDKKEFQHNNIDSITHLIKAAEMGHHDAIYKIGISSWYGTDGFKLNINKALEHLKKAAYGGNKLAAQRLVQIYKTGDRGVEQNSDLAIEFERLLLKESDK